MNKHFLTFLIISCFQYLIFNQSVYSQDYCGADSLHQALLNTDKAYRAKADQFEALWQNHLSFQYKKGLPDSIPRVIPVVFHIIHDNGPENIPDSLIYQQIDILNEDFRKMPSTPGDGAGVDTKIEFCLATIDTAGNPTTGIIRTVSPCTDASQAGCPDWPGSIVLWDPSSYLNIWVRRSFGHLGFGGVFWQIEVRYDCVGRNSIKNGRVVTHEAGHWLFLHHTFEGGCYNSNCNGNGDKVCDTPPVAAPNTGCDTSVNSCTNDVPDLNDQVKNYMDYSSCQNMFTAGQKERMHTWMDFYHYSLFTDANLQATGCHPCNPQPCFPFADFTVDKIVAGLEDPVSFTDLSYNIPINWQWTFTGGNPSSSTSQNPVVTYSVPGTYDVSLTVSNGAGSDAITKTDYIIITNQKWDSLITGTDLQGGNPFGVGAGVMEIYDNELYVGGDFITAGGNSANYIARWDGVNWNNLNGGLDINGVWAFSVYNGELYVGGNFASAGGITSPALAKWDGSNWFAVNAGIDFFSAIAIKVVNDELFVSVVDTNYNHIIKFDGSTWTLIGTADLFRKIYSLGVYNNELYAGGTFNSIDGIAAKSIAKYNGVIWSALGSGVIGGNKVINAMIEYEGDLYIGGNIDSAGGIYTVNIARWNGVQWSPVGGGLSSMVRTLEIWNNELYAGGFFSYEIGASFPTKSVARWNDNNWLPVSESYFSGGTPYFLKVYNNELYAGGDFKSLSNNGWYELIGIAKLGCSGLTAGFAHSKDTVDLSSSGDVQFTDQSGNAVTWLWNFGDGATDTLQNPLHTFWDTGTYTVSLTVSDGNCTSSASSTVYVKWDCPYLEVDFFQNEDTILITNLIDIEFISQIMYADSINFVDSILWDFGDATTGTAQNPVHSYTQLGIYTVTLTAYKDTCSNTAVSTVVVIDPTGVKELPALNDNLQIYPNPNTGQFTLKIGLQKSTRLSINIYQIYGQLIYTNEFTNITGNYIQQLDLSKYAKGIYYVQIVTDEGVLTKKVVYQ